jgi:putative ABC transport system permease protein
MFPFKEVHVRDTLLHAARTLVRRPRVTGAIALTLAVGIGVNTAVFAGLRSILLQPLPYQDPDSIVILWQGNRINGAQPRGLATGRHVLEWRERATVLTDLAAIELWQTNFTAQLDLVSDGGAERLRGAFVTPNFFSVLGVHAAHGRTFGDSDTGDLIVLSDGLWRRRFGADPDIIGRALELTAGGANRRARTFTVLGVLPRGFRFTYPQETEAWILGSWADVSRQAQTLTYNVVGRIAPGVTVDQAQESMAAMAEIMGRDLGGPYTTSTVRLEPIHEYVVGPIRMPLLLVGAVTVFLLLAASLNVTNLLMAAYSTRRRDIGIRFSLGASRAQLASELGAEAILLSLLGGILGVFLAYVTQPLLLAVIPPAFPRADEIRLDTLSLAWALLMAAGVMLAANVFPILEVSRTDPVTPLKESSLTATAGSRALHWGRRLTVVQVGAMMVALTGSGLLLRSFWNLRDIPAGFSSEDVLAVELRLLDNRFRGSDDLSAFYDNLLNRVRALPVVMDAGTTSMLPLRGPGPRRVFRLEDRTEPVLASELRVDPEYFSVLRVPIREGRVFTHEDLPGRQTVAVVSESLAAALFPGKPAVGQTLRIAVGARGPSDVSVIGVVSDVKTTRLDETESLSLYYSALQFPSSNMNLLIRHDGNSREVASAVRSIVASIDSGIPIDAITDLDRLVADTIAGRRFYSVGTTVFALIALALAAIGLYGVVARAVTERSRELAIRVAMGATRRDLMQLVLRQSLAPVALGIVTGSVLLVWLTRFLQTFLYEVSPLDLTTYAAAAAVIALASLAACLLPARRASRQDPLVALREG